MLVKLKDHENLTAKNLTKVIVITNENTFLSRNYSKY